MIERAEAEGAHSEVILKEQRFITIDRNDYGQFSTLFEAYQELYEDHLTEMKPKVLIDGAIKGMTEATGDRYTSYTAADSEEASTQELLRSNYKGIGAEVSLIDGYAVIVNPYKNAPAHDAGVLPYDRILKVNGEDVVGMELSKVTGKIKGEEGTEVTLTLQRAKGEPFDLTIVRSEIEINTVSSEMKEENGKKIGKISISSFAEETARDFEVILEELEKEEIDGLIIDVRDNGGGYLDAVKEIASEFLPIGTTILKTEDKSGKKTTVRTTNLVKNKKRYPIVLLVNEASASASEVLAAAMRESGSYPIIGTPTFGKGTIQDLRLLDDQSELKMTVGKWLTPKGVWVNEKGIQPDEIVEQPAVFTIPYLQTAKENPHGIGEVSEQIRYTQEILMFLDYELEKANGYMDVPTKNALEDYQQANELEVTGVLNEETVEFLNKTLREIKNDVVHDEQLRRAVEVVSK